MPRKVLTYPVTEVNKVIRYKHQASYDLSLIHNIINSTDVLHASFLSEDGLPTIIPLIGQMGSFERPSAGIGEPMDVYLHGYVSSRIMNMARDGEKNGGSEEGGMRICVCATKVDGLVLSLTPFTHSYNYRSAVLHGVASLVTDAAEKLWAMELITNSVCPGRWQNSRVPPDAAEMSSTQIMRVKVENGSAKVREGVPNDEKKDLSRPDVVDRIWTGVVPLYDTLAEPVPGPYNRLSEIPAHVSEYVRERNEKDREYALAAARKPAPVKLEKDNDNKEVSISHPDAVSQLLLARLHKGDFYQAVALPDHNYGNQMSELDPKEHVRKNKNIASGYALFNIMKAEPFVDAAIELLESRLDQLSQVGEKVHFDRWFNFCAFDVVGEITFSGRFGFVAEGRDIGWAIANSRKLSLYISLIGHAYWLHGLLLGNPIIGWLNLQRSNHVFDICLAAVDARKENDKVRRDMMEQWLEMRRTYPDRMEEKEILAAAVSNIAAGADTISTTVQALFYYLLRHPKHLRHLREESDTAHTRGELSRVVSHAEAQKPPYLQAWIKEAYPFHSAVSFGFPRVAGEEGVTIAGRVFPEGTVLSVNPWVIHRNTSIFGEDAESFNPERWLDQQSATLMERYLIHWGAGHNQCPGRNPAHLEVSKISATLFRDYNITQIAPNQDWTCESWLVALPKN